MGILLLLLVLLGVLLFLKKGEAFDPDVYSENYVTVDEVKAEVSFSIYTAEEWDTFFDAFQKDYLTEEMTKALLVKIGAGDYITYTGS